MLNVSNDQCSLLTIFVFLLTFHINKCNDEACDYCPVHSPRLTADMFEELHFLPDPVVQPNGDMGNFDDLYGTETTDNDRPSLKSQPVHT